MTATDPTLTYDPELVTPANGFSCMTELDALLLDDDLWSADEEETNDDAR